jgi:predicted house-cleaning noncanonical NTP pyrophosphatase (MazG superfamily)
MKTKLENNMEEIFELPSSPPISDEKMEVLPYQEDDTVDTDIDYARENLYKIVESGNDALETLLNVAKASESPRAFEVVQQFIKTMADANKDLVELQRKKKLLKGDVEKAKEIHNNLFVGSTAELQKMIKEMK